MRRVIVHYSCGNEVHRTEFEVDDEATDEDIERDAQEVALERFDWGYQVQEP